MAIANEDIAHVLISLTVGGLGAVRVDAIVLLVTKCRLVVHLDGFLNFVL